MGILKQYTVELITAGAGLIGSVTAYLIGRRKNNRDDFGILIDSYKDILDGYKDKEKLLDSEFKKLSQKASDLNTQCESLRNKIVLLESAHTSLPIPAWLKDTDGTMLALNPAYEEMFLTPLEKSREDYIGHRDNAIWNDSISKAFKKHDDYVIKKKSPYMLLSLLPHLKEI